MRSPIVAVVLSLALPSLVAACATYQDDLARSQRAFEQNQHKRALAKMSRLPSLETLETAAHRFLLAGFPLLTVGMATGLLWIGRGSTDASSADTIKNGYSRAPS